MITQSVTQEKLEVFCRRGWSLIREGNLVSLDIDPTYFELVEGSVWVARLFTPPVIRRKGYAREAMEALCAAADLEGVRLVLSINAYGDMSHAALNKFYRSLGFIYPSQLGEELMDDGLMIREVKKR